MNADSERIIELFSQAMAKPSTEERAQFLAKACRDDPELREQLESLLCAEAPARDFLKPLAAGTVKVAERVTEKPGDKIGRYKLLQQIGEGGCGVVYMAEQEEPVRRRVALKVIKLGMDTKQVIARFEAERQALALMDHPNIAKIFDAGVTDAPLTQAPHPASGHLLPSDGRGAGGEGSAHSQLSTLNPQLSSGRPYFVMELVKGIRITDFCDQNNLSTGERLDLFIKVCHAIQHAHQKGVIHRDIKPSNVLVTLHDGVPVPKIIDFGIAKATDQSLTDKTVFTAFGQFIGTPAYMSPEQAEMSPAGAGDIDTRSDIYALGVLLYELLTGKTPFDPESLMRAGLDEMRRTIREVEPVKPSTRLTQELLRTQGGKGENEKRGSEPASRSESPSPHFPSAPFPQHPAAQLPQQNETSPHRLHQMKDLIHVVRGDLDWIVMKCLEKDRTRRYETANGLASDIHRHLNNEPVVACPPSNLYRFQKLVRRNKLVFGAGAAVVISLVIGLGAATWMFFQERAGRREQARLRELAQAKEQTAQANERKAQTEAAKSGQVAQFLKDMLEGVGPSQALGRDTQMLEEILDKTAERVTNDLHEQPDVEAELLSTIGNTYVELADYLKAEAMHREALRLRTAQFGETNPSVAASLHGLGVALAYQGKKADAELILQKALTMRRELLGEEHPDVATSLHELARTFVNQDRLAEAETVYREALEMRRKLLGNKSPEVALSLSHLGSVIRQRGKLAEAEDVCREALAVFTSLRGNEHPEVAAALGRLASVLRDAGNLSEAEFLYLEELRMRRKFWGNDHPTVAVTIENLAVIARSQDKLPKAEALARECLEIREKRTPDAWERFFVESMLGECLLAQKKYAEAEPLLLSGYEGLRQREERIRVIQRWRLRKTLQRIVELYEATSRFDQAAQWKKELSDRYREEIRQYRQVAEHGNTLALDSLAWLLATCSDTTIRDGLSAVHFAEKAVALTNRENAAYLETLAAAYAEAGQFAKAVSVQKEVITLLRDEKLKNDSEFRLKLYESNTPYREPGVAPGIRWFL